MDDAERTRRGMTVRREVLGDEHVDRAVASTTSFTEPFQDFITRYAWGEIWSRPGLSRAERSIVTLAVLAALQHENELAMHVRAASVTVVVLSSCLSHVSPPRKMEHLQIHWAEDFASARAEASSTGKPILGIFAAGARDGEC